MNFKEWLLLTETTTTAQSLKQAMSDPEKENTISQIKSKVQRIVDQFPQNLTPKYKSNIINFYTWNFLKTLPIQTTPIINTTRLSDIVDKTKDYLIANSYNAVLLSKINNPTFTFDELIKYSDDWHRDLETKKAKPAREANTFIDLSHLGPNWTGWRWVSLDRSYCEMEKESLGHCGNAAYKEGDNILSLRDPQNIAHLTFIENKGVLGETKGRSNSKPSPKYHQAIVELLKNDKIISIRGGGYLSENNFSLDDLSNKEELLKLKPKLDFAVYRDEYIQSLLKLSPKEKIAEVESILDEKFELDNKNDYVYMRFGSTKEFMSWMAKWTDTKIKRNTDYDFLDKLMSHDINVNTHAENYDIDEIIGNISRENFKKIQKMAENEDVTLDTPEDISQLEESDFKDKIMQLIQDSYQNSLEESYHDAYWNNFKSSFESNKDSDYLLNRIYDYDDIRLVLNQNLMNDIITEFSDPNQTGSENLSYILNHLYYTYDVDDASPSFDKKLFNQYLDSII